MKKRHAWMALAGAAIFVLGGCDLFGSKEAPQLPPLVVPPPPVPGAVPAVPPVPDAPPPAAPTGAALPEFQWTETPAVNIIPDAPLGGMANGSPFMAQSVIFEPGADSWKMIIRDQPLASPTDIASGGQFITINLPVPPSTGMTWMRPMSYGDGFFQVMTDPTNPEQTTSWNADNAWALEITNWQTADWNSSGPSSQYAGQASGRIAVTYKGSGNMQNSWVAGRFDNAIIRYMGQPYWARDAAKTGAPSTGTGAAAGAKKTLEEKASDLIDKLPADPPPADPPAAEEPPKDSAEGTAPMLQIDVDKLKGRFEELKRRAKEIQEEQQ